MITFKCDVHKGMNAFVRRARPSVLHTAGRDSRFELRVCRPAYWSKRGKKLGTQTQTVTIGEEADQRPGIHVQS
jgi:hypothetical protein